jgi:hypothetical protein
VNNGNLYLAEKILHLRGSGLPMFQTSSAYIKRNFPEEANIPSLAVPLHTVFIVLRFFSHGAVVKYEG